MDTPAVAPATGSPAPAPAELPAQGSGPEGDAVERVEEAEVTAVAIDGAKTSHDRSTWYGETWPSFDRIVDAYTARTSRRGTFNTVVAHRNNAGFARAPFDTLFGFDQGLLKVGLGLRYGLLERLDVGVYRLNGTVEVFDTYDFDVRYRLVSQEVAGLDLAVRAGLSWFAQPGKLKDAAAPFASLLVDRLVANRVLVGASLLYHQNSSGPRKTNLDAKLSVAAQMYADVRLREGLSLALELTVPLAGYQQPNPDVTFGPRFITNRHTFAVVLSNTQYYDAAGIVTGNLRTNFRDWVLGFAITREL